MLPAVQVRAGCASSSVEGPGFAWFEVVGRADRVCIVVGDTVAEGLVAASVAAQLRGIVGQALAAGAAPEEALEQLQRYAAHTPQVAGSNVVVASVETGTGRTRACHRGHLPPLVLGRDGRPRALAVAPAPPLGVAGHSGCVEDRLQDGETLVLFSNAMVDRSTGSVDARLRHLRRDIGSDPVTPLSATVANVLAHRLRDARGRSDDATVVAARFSARPRAPFDSGAIRSPGEQRAARLGLRTWLQDLDVGDDIAFGIEQAVAAALAHLGNEVHPVSDCAVHAVAALGADGALTVTLRHTCSSGTGAQETPRRDETRALGLILLLHLVEDVDVQRPHDGRGTVVRLRQSLSAPTMFAPSEPAMRAAPATALEASLSREDAHRVLLLRGALRPGTLEDLRLALAATAVAPSPVVLELSEVTELGGAGLALLHRLVGAGAVELRAATGSPAASVMRSSALPFQSTPALAT